MRPVGRLGWPTGRLMARIGSSVVVLLLLSITSFSLINLLPGDPTTSLLPPGSTPEEVTQLRHELRLDSAVEVRYVQWVSRVVRGDLGTSYRTGEPVVSALRRGSVVTAELVLFVQLFSFIVGILVGLLSARYVGGWFDRLLQTLSFGVLAIPSFALALVLLLVFAVHLHWFPAVGFVHLTDSTLRNIRAMVMPTVTLGLPLAARYGRVLRGEMISNLQSDHVVLARAMGVPERRILLRHVLRLSSFSLLTIFGLEFGLLIGAAVVVERIFAVPGIGMLLVDSVGHREYFVLQGAVVLIGAVFVMTSLLTDVAQTLLDPRLRVRRVAS